MLIALAGRTSVGKSTLFNRLSKSHNKSITHVTKGVTRDYKIAKVKLFDLNFQLVDTAGIENISNLNNLNLGNLSLGNLSEKEVLQSHASKKSLSILQKSDFILFVLDGKVGVTSFDIEMARFIQKYVTSEVIVVVNKCEKDIVITQDYYSLGFGFPVSISAAHGIGMQDLFDMLHQRINLQTLKNVNILNDHDKTQNNEPGVLDSENELSEDALHLAIVGRPNSGKSTYINSLIQEDRLLTSSIAGTTRDAVDVQWTYKNQKIILIDTAGLRKKNKIDEKIEFLSSKQTINAVHNANVCALMLDSQRGLEDQDLKIANLILNNDKCLILVFNKWDLIENKKVYQDEISYILTRKLAQLTSPPTIYLSAQNKNNIFALIDQAIICKKKFAVKISTSKLNAWLGKVTSTYSPTVPKTGKLIKIKYCVQVAQNPPTFKLFGNYNISEGYKKYLAKSLREYFDIEGIPVKFIFSKSDNPYLKSISGFCKKNA